MLSLRRSLVAIAISAAFVAACSSDDASVNDGGAEADGSHADGSSAVDSGGDGSGGNDGGGVDGARSDGGSNDASTGDGTVDTGSQDSQSSFDASDDIVITDSGTCNALVNGGAYIDETNVAGSPPAATGGTLPHPALWYFTKWEVFGALPLGPTGNKRKVAFQFGASVYYKVTQDMGGGEEHDTRTWSTSGTTLTSNQVCPTIDNLTSDYSYSGNTLVLIAGQNVLTFTRQ